MGAEAIDQTDSIDEVRRAWQRLHPEIDTSVMGTVGRVIRAARHVAILSDQALTQFGITRGEFDVLSVLRRSSESFTASELARSLVTSNAAITKRMVQLERAGLAVRERDSADRRVVRLTLTPEGTALIDAALPAQLAFESSVAAVLEPQSQAQLEAALRVLLVELERRSAG